MKYIVSCHQPLNYLKEADEIKVEYKDIGILPDLIEKDWHYPGTIFLWTREADEINWTKINAFKDVLNIVIGVENFNHYHQIIDNGYKFFWTFPITSYWELNRIIKTGASYVILGAPLYFDLVEINTRYENVEIMLYANECYNDYLPCENGVNGTYIRPEDVTAYELFVKHLMFVTNDLQKERTLTKIYKSGQWNGNLNLLLDNLNYDIDNRAISPEGPMGFADRRISCKQRCQEKYNCKFCQIHFDFITSIDKNKNWLQELLD